MILHAMDIHRAGGIVHILSPDTDMFILALQHFPSIGREACVYLGTGQKQHLVPLKPIYDIIGSDMAAALPGFHSFTGCDTTGRFAGKGKLTCWNTIQKAGPRVVEAFSLLGTTDMPPDRVLQCLEEYVCKLYSSATNAKSVGKLQWQLFKRSQSEAEKLPPTSDTLRHHILRAHFQAMVWHHAGDAKPELPSPVSYGWKREATHFVPIITSVKPAPDAVVELVKCGCSVGMCRGGNCSCRRVGMLCTRMCTCEGVEETCTNTELDSLNMK